MKKNNVEQSELKVNIIGGFAGSGNSAKLKYLAKTFKDQNHVNVLIDSEGVFQHLRKDKENADLFNHVLSYSENKDDIKSFLRNLRELTNTVENQDKICIYIYGVVTNINLVKMESEISDLAEKRDIKLFYTLQSIAHMK